MKITKNLFGIAALSLCLGFASCSDDDDLLYSEGQVTNNELRTVLEQNGLHFDEQGHLLLDEAANNLKALDLSGKKISDYKELAVLPNLTELNLSNNEFGPTFDFSILPAQITAVDLTGNEIYEFKNLVNIETAENGEENVTLVRDMAKLYLPESAKHNCVEIPSYFTTDKEVDMKMGNAPYTTLREVPDATVREMLQELYPSLFNKDGKIDLSARMAKANERAANLNISMWTLPDGKTVSDVEGVQYVVMNPSFRAGMVWFETTKECTIPYLKLNPSTTYFEIHGVNTPNLDITPAKDLMAIKIHKNNDVENIDLTQCTQMGQRSLEVESEVGTASQIELISCANLKSITLPKKAYYIYRINVEDSPLLENFDFSQLKLVTALGFCSLPKCKLNYLTFDEDLLAKIKCQFATSEDFYNSNKETKAFLDKYHEKMFSGNTYTGGFFLWERLY